MRQLKVEEVDTYSAFTVTNGIDNSPADSGKLNAELFVGLIVDKWQKEINQETLTQALNILRPHVSFLEPQEAEYQRLSMKMTQDEQNAILGFIPHFHLANETRSEQLVNFNAIATWFLSHGQPINWSNLNRLGSNVANQPNSKLIWQRRLQDSEREAIRQKEENAKRHEAYEKAHPGSKSNPEFLDGPLAAWKAMLQRPLRPGDVGYEPPEKTQADQHQVTYWESYARRRVHYDMSTIQQAEAEPIIREAEATGKWAEAARRIDYAISKKHADNAVARSISQGGGNSR
jgi:hypothetical protein